VKSLIVSGLSFIIIVTFQNPCIGQGYYNSYNIGGGLCYAAENSNIKSGIGFDANITFLTDNIIAIRASIGRYETDVKVNKLSEGNYSLLWIEGTMLLRSQSPIIQPYGGLGVGYYITGHELSSNVDRFFAQYGLLGKEDIQDNIGIHLRSGLDIPISWTMSINLDIKYIFLKPNVKVKVTNLYTSESVKVTEAVDLSTLLFGFSFSINL